MISANLNLEYQRSENQNEKRSDCKNAGFNVDKRL